MTRLVGLVMRSTYSKYTLQAVWLLVMFDVCAGHCFYVKNLDAGSARWRRLQSKRKEVGALSLAPLRELNYEFCIG